MRGGLAACLMGAALWAAPLAAQDTSDPVAAGGVLVVDSERLFVGSQTGQRLLAQLDAEATELSAENRRIESQLEAEEQQLTDERPGMEPAQFRERAEAFDIKVVEIRAAQDEKVRDLNRRRDTMRQDFYQQVLPLLAEITRERGASVVLESRQVFIAAGQVNITTEAIARIDAALAAPAPEAQDEDPATPVE